MSGIITSVLCVAILSVAVYTLFHVAIMVLNVLVDK